MNMRSFAFGVSIFSLTLGILGLLGMLSYPPSNQGQVTDVPYMYLFGFLPTNTFLNILRIILGGIGLFAMRSRDYARSYIITCVGVWGVFAGMGLIPALATAFGYLPLFGYNVLLHAVGAAVGVYALGNEVLRVQRTDVASDKIKVFEDRSVS